MTEFDTVSVKQDTSAHPSARTLHENEMPEIEQSCMFPIDFFALLFSALKSESIRVIGRTFVCSCFAIHPRSAV